MEQDDYAWYLEHDLREYAGKWVAICKRKVVCAHEDLEMVMREVRAKFGLAAVSLARIPEKDVALAY